MERGTTSSVQSLDRALSLLEHLADAGGSMRLSELEQTTGLPLPTVHRLLKSLMHNGYVRQDASRRYALGPRLVRIGEVAGRALGSWSLPSLAALLAEIGEKAGTTVSDEELQRALFETIRRFPADQQQQVYEFYRSNPNALTSIRAPLFEEKVIDHLLTQIDVTDKKVSREELMAEDEAEGAEEPATKTAEKETGGETAEAPKKAPRAKKKPAASESATDEGAQ